ncbi:hypothetical protein GCM10023178_10590 [Actinomadura luteofluorescens]
MSFSVSAGLVLALRLRQEGIGCEGYEQSEKLRELGVGLNALPYAVRELDRLGLLVRLDDVGIRTRELFYAHRLGHQILHRPCGTDAGLSYPQIGVHRGRLQSVLLRAVREGWDRTRSGWGTVSSISSRTPRKCAPSAWTGVGMRSLRRAVMSRGRRRDPFDGAVLDVPR